MPKWLQILKVVGPVLVGVLVPGGPMLAPIIVGAIESAEKMKGATGPEKKAHALELVQAGVSGMNTVAGKTVVMPADAVATASSVIDTVVGVTNIIDQVHAIEGTAPTPVGPLTS